METQSMSQDATQTMPEAHGPSQGVSNTSAAPGPAVRTTTDQSRYSFESLLIFARR